MGIECTCDDSSVAIYSLEEKKIINQITYSSRDEYHQYGGIVPEIAARAHEKNLFRSLEEALNSCKLKMEDISYISYSAEPGLDSSILSGRMLATTLAVALDKVLLPINHLEAHVFSIGLQEKLIFPSLTLLITGKNTIIYQLIDNKRIIKLDECKDCALGEAYDKVARIMGLKYPGGPLLEKYYNKYKEFPPLTRRSKNITKLTLNFSGLITASDRYWKKLQENENLSLDKKREALSTAFQREIIEILLIKLKYWAQKSSIKQLYIVGGVSKNVIIRENLLKFFLENNLNCSFISPDLAEDNGAMIAYRASLLI